MAAFINEFCFLLRHLSSPKAFKTKSNKFAALKISWLHKTSAIRLLIALGSSFKYSVDGLNVY